MVEVERPDYAIIVRLLYSHLEGKITGRRFDTLFKRFIYKRLDKNTPAWVLTIKKSFESMSDDPDLIEDLAYISRDSFRYDVLMILRYLQKKGLYTDIIKRNLLWF